MQDASDTALAAALTALNVPLAVEGTSGHTILVNRANECMSTTAFAQYTKLHYLRRLGDRCSLRDVGDWRLIVPVHPETPYNGKPMVNVLALMRVPLLTQMLVRQMADYVTGLRANIVVAFESRAMTLAGAVCSACAAAFVPARLDKSVGAHVVTSIVQDADSYRARASVAIDGEPFSSDDRVVIVDDVVSTGATLDTLADVIEKLGAKVVGRIAVVAVGPDPPSNTTVLATFDNLTVEFPKHMNTSQS